MPTGGGVRCGRRAVAAPGRGRAPPSPPEPRAARAGPWWLEAGRVRALAGGLEFDIAHEQAVPVDGEIGAPKAVGQRRLAGADDLPTQRARRFRHQGLEGSAQPLLGRTGRHARRLGRHRRGERSQRPIDGSVTAGHRRLQKAKDEGRRGAWSNGEHPTAVPTFESALATNTADERYPCRAWKRTGGRRRCPK